MILKSTFVFVFYISITVTYSHLIHIFHLIIVYLIVGLIHYWFFHPNNNYRNKCLTFPVVNSLIFRCDSE